MPPPPVRADRSVVVAGAALGGLVLLTAAVLLGLTQPLDDAVRELARPGDVWGTPQRAADHVVEGLRPTVLMPSLLVVAAVLGAVRRSLRPAVVAVLAGGAAALGTLAVKVAVGRPDPHATGQSHGGSFPSGHTVSAMVCLGLVVILVRPAARRVWAVPALAGGSMGVALVVQAAHWATDVLGGALLAVAVLAQVRRVIRPGGQVR